MPVTPTSSLSPEAALVLDDSRRGERCHLVDSIGADAINTVCASIPCGHVVAYGKLADEQRGGGRNVTMLILIPSVMFLFNFLAEARQMLRRIMRHMAQPRVQLVTATTTATALLHQRPFMTPATQEPCGICLAVMVILTVCVCV